MDYPIRNLHRIFTHCDCHNCLVFIVKIKKCSKIYPRQDISINNQQWFSRRFKQLKPTGSAQWLRFMDIMNLHAILIAIPKMTDDAFGLVVRCHMNTMNTNDKQHRAILQSIARRAMLERSLLPDFSAEALAELGRIQAPAVAMNGESSGY